MEVIRYLKQIYQGKNALSNHITLFSLIGIMFILLSTYFAPWGNIFFSDFFVNPLSDRFQIYLTLFAGLSIYVYLIGYSFNYVYKSVKNGEYSIPNFTFEPVIVFMKMLPVFIVWKIYYFIVWGVGIYMFLLYDKFALAYIFSSIMICIIPFILMQFVKFAFEFNYKKVFFSPVSLFKNIDKTLGDVIFLSVEIFILAILPVVLVYGMLIAADDVSSRIMKSALRYGGFCIGFYLLAVLQYVYFIGLAGIVKRNIPD